MMMQHRETSITDGGAWWTQTTDGCSKAVVFIDRDIRKQERTAVDWQHKNNYFSHLNIKLTAEMSREKSSGPRTEP